MNNVRDFGDRRAPYAPISALERFFERIRDLAVPDQVDQRYLQRLGVASNNEYALLSALKFLDIIDERGRPTHVYHQLQTTDHFQPTLRHLVQTAYAPLFDAGVEHLSHGQLVDWFRTNSSASQAKNAARFFQLVCRLAGLSRTSQGVVDGPIVLPDPSLARVPDSDFSNQSVHPVTAPHQPAPLASPVRPATDSAILAARAALLAKLPAPDNRWSPDQYTRVCELFTVMLAGLNTLPPSADTVD